MSGFVEPSARGFLGTAYSNAFAAGQILHRIYVSGDANDGYPVDVSVERARRLLADALADAHSFVTRGGCESGGVS